MPGLDRPATESARRVGGHLAGAAQALAPDLWNHSPRGRRLEVQTAGSGCHSLSAESVCAGAQNLCQSRRAAGPALVPGGAEHSGGRRVFSQKADQTAGSHRTAGAERQNDSHAEKDFSLVDPHTEWISKGKVSAPVERGHKVLLTTDP